MQLKYGHNEKILHTNEEYSHTHTHTLSLSLSLSHTHTLSLLSLSLTHTHTHSLSLSLSLSLSHFSMFPLQSMSSSQFTRIFIISSSVRTPLPAIGSKYTYYIITMSPIMSQL